MKFAEGAVLSVRCFAPSPLWLTSAVVLLAVVMCSRVQAQSTPPESQYFSTVGEEAYSTYQVPGNGDLWPSCWADDDNLYTASGDGTAFSKSSASHDMTVSKISGRPPNLVGTTLAKNVGTNWSGSAFYRKPTGMLCINSTVYLAFQNLQRTTFNSAPAASIAKSTDYGSTWTWDTKAPMFGGAPKPPLFTTIFFLDFGKNSSNALDQYVYAYGLDNNWRSQQSLYLARVLNSSVQTRSAWQFFTGVDGSGIPSWSSDITRKVPVLSDTRLLYPVMFGTDCPANQPVIAQGGVVYDKPLDRYLFTTWSCATHELYEAPDPWGPWKHVLSNDFGPLRLLQNRGQYATTIPSKFVSADGKTMMLQSNVCCGGNSYTFSLRKLYLQLPLATFPQNAQSNANLALAPGVRAVSKSTHFGSLCGLNCSDQLNSGVLNKSEDDFDEESKPLDWWGYMWPQPYNLDEVVYEAGNVYSDGGWFADNLHVQVYQGSAWVDVPGPVTVSPTYPYNSGAGAQATYTFDFPATWGSGVRVIGGPGGSSHFTAISQLGVYYGGRNLVADPGFEAQMSATAVDPWSVEGPDLHTIDVSARLSHSGLNDASIQSSSTSWNAYTQTVPVQPNTNYTLTGWVQTNLITSQGSFGVRTANGSTIVRQAAFGAAASYTPLTLMFNSGSNSTLTIFAGFKGQNTSAWMRLDDVALR
jgi:hypothetical protein